ncbi:hypothetical protein ACOMHN_001394 [Nucella lapillus]
MGVAVAYSCFSPETVLPNLLMYTGHRRRKNTEDELSLMRTVCRVCGQKKCPRHRPELNILAFQPWTNLEIHQKVDEALEEFINLVLKEYVYTWYKELSLDDEFLDELRTNIRFLASVLFRRMRKVDVSHMVIHKLARAAVQHVDAVVQANRDSVPHDSDLQQATLDYLGSNVHCAMWSRKAEAEYLRRLTESLFPYILRPQALNSRSTCALVREILCGSVLLPAMDAIANPDMVNNLLLIFLDNTPPPEATDPPSPRVQFLGHFVQAQATNQSCLRLELNDVTNAGAPQLLYPFMQFLKSEAAVNVLQFCLSCEDFNKQILSPDVSQSEFVALHNAAKDLYRTYVAPDALDRIKFDEDVVTELRDVVEGPPDQVIRLRTSTPLFKAYEHAYDLLQHTFLPMFHQSDDYYLMLCGDRPNSSTSRQLPNSLQSLKTNNSRASRKKDFGFSNIGSKIKDVFRSTSEDRVSGDEGSEGLLASTQPQAMGRVDEEMPTLEPMYPGCDREAHDLSSWRVTIPRTGVRPDQDNIRKHYHVFIIDVRRVDVQEGDRSKCSCWTVARRYPEFYVLEQKLTEFHGEFEDCQLPPKKSFGTKTQEFTESKKDVFEQYLQKLLTKPHLKGSELLHNFLTSEDEFTSSFLPDIKIGKFVKSMPMKLVKEKGQHLDPFLSNFEKSTEAPKPRPSKPERRDSDVSLISTSSEKMVSGLYENNANSGFAPPLNKVEKPADATTFEVEGFFDSLIYFAREVYSVPEWMHHTLVTARMLVKNSVESYLEGYLDNKVTQVTQEHRVISLVHLLRDVLFFDTDPPRTDEQKKRRYEEALNGFIDFIPSYVASVVGSRKTVEGSKFLVDVFQKPKLNKQLSYVMLDILITELFPELKETVSPPRSPPRSP